MRLHGRRGWILAVCAVLLLAACGGGTQGEKSKSGLTEVRYGLPTASYFITTVGIQYALQKGYFRDEGLDVKVTALPGATTAIRSMLSGEQQIVNTGGDTAFLSWQNGAPIKIIDSPIAKGTDVLIARSGIKSIADLAGKRFAISDPGSTAEVLGKLLLKRNGVNPDSVQFVALGSPADRIRAMLAGQVDATAATILVLQPVLKAIDEGKVNVLTSFAKEFPDIPLSYNITTDRMIQQHSDVLVRFLRAEIRGYRWAQENPEEAAKIAVNYIKETPLEVLTQGTKGIAELGVYGVDGGITPEGITKTQKALQELGSLKEAAKPTEVANFQLVQRSLSGSG
jgi:NitT/TauT family transport system substrate-binding protein